MCREWLIYSASIDVDVLYKHTFKIGNNTLENVKEYTYLGVTFTKLNSFKNTKIRPKQQATKAMYLNVPLDGLANFIIWM